jgi:hypothetical protein
MTEVPDCGAAPRRAPADSGVLARVPGQCIAQASKSLPDPACALDEEMSIEIDAARVGRVRLTFRKQRYSRPRGKVSYFPGSADTPNTSLTHRHKIRTVCGKS